MAANARVDPILVACLVDSSAALLYEWNQILQAYISPLLQRIATIHTNSRNNRVSQETIRIGIVSYSDRNVHPDPILARRFFAPVSLITRELKDEPTSLGLGHTAPGNDAGMAVLEGYVAVLEMFDAVAETRPLPPQIMENAELPPYEPALYLLHIAAVKPDSASKPIWNQNHLLDDVTWSSLPAEILKRKIRHNMILTKSIPQLQEFYKNIYRSPENHGISILKSSHKLLFFNPPSDVKIIPQKRAASDNVDIEAAPVSVPPPNTAGSQLATPHQAHPAPDAQGQANNNESSQQVHQRTPFDMNRLRTIFFSLESDIQNAKATLDQAKLSGKPQSELDAIENDLKLKTQQRMGLIHYSYRMAQKQAASGAAQHPQATNPGAQMPKLSTHPQSNANTLSTGQSAPNTIPPSNPFPNMLAPTRPGMSTQMEKLIAERMRPPVVAAAPTGVQPTQSQLQPQPLESQSQPHQTQLQSQSQSQLLQPQPQLQLQPQPQPQPQPHPQPHPQPQSQSQQQQQPQTHPQPQTQLPTHSQVQPQSQTHTLSSHQFQPQAGAAAPPPGQVTSPLPPHPDILADKPILANFPKRWQGSFAWSLGPREAVVRVALYTQDTTLHPESWPSTLRFVQGHAPINSGQIQIWLKEKNAVVSLVSHTPYSGNDEATIQNYRLFKLVRDWCQNKNVLLYCQFDMPEAPQGSGALLFPLQGSSPALSGETFVCMIFNKTPLPVEVLRLPPSMAPSQGVNQNDPTLNVQANPSAAMHNMANIASDAYLPQQKMQALASFQKKQELAQKANMQRNMMQNLAGISMAPFGGANGPNINQLLQAGQQQSSNSIEQNVASNGGLNLAPQAQTPLVHRQGAPNLTAAQMAQLLHGMNRNPDASG